MKTQIPTPVVPPVWSNEPEKYFEMLRRLNEKEGEALLEVEKKRRIKADSVEESIKYEELKADIASQREMQRTEVIISKEGEIEVSQRQFGSRKAEKIPFTVSKFFLLHGIGVKWKTILRVVFLHRNGIEVDLYFCMQDLGDCKLNKKFNEGGICFGFSHRKETQLRRLLVMKLMSIAQEVELPLSYGWFRDSEGKLHFAFPEDAVWEEVKEYAS